MRIQILYAAVLLLLLPIVSAEDFEFERYITQDKLSSFASTLKDQFGAYITTISENIIIFLSFLEIKPGDVILFLIIMLIVLLLVNKLQGSAVSSLGSAAPQVLIISTIIFLIINKIF